jgi:transcriptional regulator
MPATDLDLIRGTLDVLILKALTGSPRHGLEVMRWIEEAARDRLQIEEGALYPALHRLEARDWLESAWGHTDQGRRAKYYRLTPAGRRHLAAEITRWNRYTQTVNLVLAAEPDR